MDEPVKTKPVKTIAGMFGIIGFRPCGCLIYFGIAYEDRAPDPSHARSLQEALRVGGVVRGVSLDAAHPLIRDASLSCAQCHPDLHQPAQPTTPAPSPRP